MEIKEMRVGPDGLDAKLTIQGQEIKVGNLKDKKELLNAQSYLCVVICEQFFELANMYAKEKGIELYELFENENHLDNSFKNYLFDFCEQLVKNAVIHSKANWELFKRQREDAKNPHYDA